MFINSKTNCKHLGLTAGNDLLAEVQLMRIWVRVLKVSVMYLSTIRYATFDVYWPFFPKGSEKIQSSNARLLIQVMDSTPTSAAAGTIVDDPPLVDHPLVISAANVSEETAVETSMNLQ
jgi:hypothetical protein